ncbi:MAG: hypothetical protein U5J63_07995 [Fodinibius sp.]|nr:hypothetical protein [Fodinibius sp.]
MPDEIAYEINPDDPASVRLQAGRAFYNRFYNVIEKEKDLLIEILPYRGGQESDMIERIQTEYHYLVTLLFIFLDSEALCIERVKNRVSKGGASRSSQRYYPQIRQQVIG